MVCALKNKKYHELKEKYGEVDAYHLSINEPSSEGSPFGNLESFRELVQEVQSKLELYTNRYGQYTSNPTAYNIALALHKAQQTNTPLEPRIVASPTSKMISVLEDLSERFGIPYELTNDPDDKRKGWYENIDGKKMVVINTAHATDDTPFHEFTHPVVRLIKTLNPPLFEQLSAKTQATNHIADPEESLTEALGRELGSRSLFQRIIDYLKTLFFKAYNLTPDRLSQLTPYTTLKELTNLLQAKVDVSSENTLISANQLLNQVKNAIEGKFKDSVDKVTTDQIAELVKQSTTLTTNDESNHYFDESGNKVGTRMTYFVGDREGGVFSVRYKGKVLLSDREIAIRKFAEAGLRPDQKITLESGRLILSLDEYAEYISIKRTENRIIGKAQHAYLAHLSEESEERSKMLLDEALGYTKALGHKDFSTFREITTIKDDYVKILTLSGVTPKNVAGATPDKFFPELTLKSDILKDSEGLPLVTTADGLVLHANGELTLVDYKTGNITSDIDVNTLMAYANDLHITDSKINKAYLELALRVIILKEKMPTARFRAIKLVKIDNSGNGHHTSHDVDLQPFLDLVTNYYKKENPQVLTELRDKNLLDETQYTGLSSYVVKYQKILENLPFHERLKWVDNKLAELTLGVSKEKLDSQPDVIKQQRAALAELRLELSKQPGTSLQGDTEDIDRFLGQIKNMSDIKNSKFQVFHRELLKAKGDAKAEFDSIAEKEATLLQAVLEEAGAAEGKTSVIKKIFKTSLLAAGVISANPFLLGASIVTQVIDQRIKKSPKDVFNFMWAKGQDGDYLNTGDTYYDKGTPKTLTKAQREYRDFIQSTMAEVWSSTMSRTSNYTGRGNRLLTKAEALGYPPQLNSDFLPRIPKSVDEMRMEEEYSSGYFGLQTRLKHWTKRTLSNFIEGNYYSEDKGGIPVKYYAHYGDNNVLSSNHSYNVHEAFRMFIGNLVTKKHLDDMYVLAEGVKNIYETHTDEAGRKDLDNLAHFVDSVIYNQILSKPKEVRFSSSPIILPPNRFFGNEQPIEINQDKLLRTLKAGVSFSVMGFKVVGAAFNTALITITNTMHSTKAIWGAILGADPDDINVNKGAVTKAYGYYANHLKHVMLGTPHKSKIWQMAKKFDWIPDNFGYGMSKEDLLYDVTSKGLFSHAFMFHNFTETYGALVHLGIMMNSVQVQTSKGKKTLWELYDNEGNYIGGKRGVTQVAPGEFKDLNELDDREIKNLKRAFEKVHGSYRKEEKTALEATVWGEFLIQFKKFFYTYMKNLYGSEYSDSTVGRYVIDKDTTRPDGIPVWKWEEEMMEGRMRVLVGGMFAAQGLNKFTLGIGDKNYYGIKGDRNKVQKNRLHRLVELANTAMWFSLMYLIYGAAFDDDEDDTYAAFRFRRLAEDTSMGLLPKDVFNTVEKPVVAIERVSKVGKAFFSFATGGENKDGSHKGLSTLVNATPILGNVNQVLETFGSKKVSDSDYLFGILPLSNNR